MFVEPVSVVNGSRQSYLLSQSVGLRVWALEYSCWRGALSSAVDQWGASPAYNVAPLCLSFHLC